LRIFKENTLVQFKAERKSKWLARTSSKDEYGLSR